MTNIYFVRHAHSVYSLDETGRPLSPDGLKDAQEVAGILKNHHIDHVISSPYKRAIQTVEPLAAQFSLTIELVDNFRERTLSKHPVSNFNEAIAKVWKDPSFAWEGGESNIVAQERGINSFLSLLDKWEGKNVVIGTHGNIMVLIMNYFNPVFDVTFWEQLRIPDIYCLTFEKQELVHTKRIAREEVLS